MSREVDDYLMTFLDNPWNVIGAAAFLLLLVIVYVWPQYVRLVIKSLGRSPLRTLLMTLATFMLVMIITLIWSVLWLLDLVMTERSKDFKAIVTERWQLPSQMPYAYENSLKEGAAAKNNDVKPQDYMTWSFYGGTLDERKAREDLVFFFCVDPAKVMSMMDDFADLSPADAQVMKDALRAMEQDHRRVLIGRDRMEAIHKQAGERIKLFSINYQGIDLDECEIYAVIPDGRLPLFGLMHRDRLSDALEAYKTKTGKTHPLAGKSLNLVWLKVPDTASYNRIADQILNSPIYTDPAVKIETASSGIASFLDPYRDMLWGVRWLLVPSILAVLSLVIATAISITVRERRVEMAVLKVLGFGPTQIMLMVLAEALLLGCLAGLLSAGGTFLVVNKVMGGFKFPIAFFPAFRIPVDAWWWGPVLGGLTALVGSIVPAWSARSVKVSQVFAKLS